MEKRRCSDLPVELEAARLAIEWKHLFATELRIAAQQLAIGAQCVTADEYRRALATATQRVLDTVNTRQIEPANVRRRSA